MLSDEIEHRKVSLINFCLYEIQIINNKYKRGESMENVLNDFY